jgi:hypothetical protein
MNLGLGGLLTLPSRGITSRAAAALILYRFNQTPIPVIGTLL